MKTPFIIEFGDAKFRIIKESKILDDNINYYDYDYRYNNLSNVIYLYGYSLNGNFRIIKINEDYETRFTCKPFYNNKTDIKPKAIKTVKLPKIARVFFDPEYKNNEFNQQILSSGVLLYESITPVISYIISERSKAELSANYGNIHGEVVHPEGIQW